MSRSMTANEFAGMDKDGYYWICSHQNCARVEESAKVDDNESDDKVSNNTENDVERDDKFSSDTENDVESHVEEATKKEDNQ